MSSIPEQRGRLFLVVDTNVWMDYFLGFRPGSDSARTFMETARAARVQLSYPIGILQDVFWFLTSELKRDVRSDKIELTEVDVQAIRRMAWGCIDAMREMAVAVGADEADAWLACKYRGVCWDLEDNMVIAAARRAKADYLVTSDHALITKSPVAAMTPADMTQLLRDCM